jgi:hypothetical protein
MKVAIHQLHYFPWLGYFEKMARADKFILLDDVQLTDSSNMFRNRLLALSGTPKFITIPFDHNGYMNKTFRELSLNNTIYWQKVHMNFIRENYKNTPFFSEVWERIDFIFEKKYEFLFEVTFDSLIVLREILKISTEVVLQSTLNYSHAGKKNQLVLDLCCAVGADQYLSGNGAKKYMECKPFEEKGIIVEFQNFNQIGYPQFSKKDQFVTGLSVLDMLFNIGINECQAALNQNKNTL